MRLSEIEFHELHASYGHDGRRELLAFKKPKTLILQPGQICTLRGDNGTGKSSFIRAIYGDVPVVRGSIMLRFDNGNDRYAHGDRLPAMLPTAYLPQRPGGMFPRDTAVRTLFDAWASVGSRFAHRAAQRELLDSLGISERMDGLWWKHCEHMSGGESQLVGLLLCFLRDPTLILLDEPTSLISREARVHVLRLIRRLGALEGSQRFMIIASHDEEIERMSYQTLSFD